MTFHFGFHIDLEARVINLHGAIDDSLRLCSFKISLVTRTGSGQGLNPFVRAH